MTSYCTGGSLKVLLVLFIPFLFLCTFLVFDLKVGLIILAGSALFLTALLKPKVIYLLLLALFSMEGFTAVPGSSFAKLLGILLIAGLTLRLAMTREAIPKDSSYKYFLLLLTGGIVSFGFAKNLSVSLHSYITFISVFLLYGMTRYFLISIEDVNSSLNVLFLSTVLTFLIVQVAGLSQHDVGQTSRISSGMGDPNEFASYILVLLPLAYYKATIDWGVKRILNWAFIALFLVLLVLSGSRGGLLGFLGAAAVLIYYYSIGRLRQIFFLILIAAAIFYFAVPHDFWTRASTIVHPKTKGDVSIAVRLENYQAALKMFRHHPLAGVGLRNFEFNGAKYGASAQTVVHNTYLEVLTGGGLLCFIPFFLIIADSWRKLRLRKSYDRRIRDLLICLKAAFVSLLITSFFISVENKKIMWFLFALISTVFYVVENQRMVRGTRHPQ